jgi:hypothetical protein
MQATNPNAYTYVNGTDVETHRNGGFIDVAARGCSPVLSSAEHDYGTRMLRLKGKV